MQIPNETRQYAQPNDGDSSGNLYATYGIDLLTNRGRLRSSTGVVTAIDSTDDADFDGYAAQIAQYGNRTLAVTDNVFFTTTDGITTSWSEDTASGNPTSGNTIMDATVFDGLFLVSTTTNILSWNGSAWANWWTTTLGASALTSGHRHLLRVGADGNLYVTDHGNKVYRVDPDTGETVSGQGTLDFSATSHIFTCMETTSSRLFIGTEHESEAVIIEWDMSPSSIAANRIHKVGSTKVMCIAVWNDIPIAVLRNGKIKYFDGTSFVDYDGMQFPVASQILLDEQFIHPNGWAIIDNLPHFLVSGKVETGGSELAETGTSQWNIPSGVWCLDPKIGLYHRFPLNQLSVSAVGALYALNRTDTKFLASYEYFNDAGTTVSTLDYHDYTVHTPCFYVTPFIDTPKDAWDYLKLVHKKLSASEHMRVWYRFENEDSEPLSGTWSSTTQFHTTDTTTAVEGQLVMVKVGATPMLSRIVDVETSLSTTVITIADAASVTTGDTGYIEVLNFKWMGTVDDVGMTEHTFSFPDLSRQRKAQVLVELRPQGIMEIDYSIIE